MTGGVFLTSKIYEFRDYFEIMRTLGEEDQLLCAKCYQSFFESYSKTLRYGVWLE